MAGFHAQRLSVGKGGWFSPRSSCSHSPPAPASGALLPGEGTGTFPFREVNPSEGESVAACRVPYGDPPSGKTSAWHQSETSVVFPSPHPVANTDSVIKDKNPDAAQMSSTESAPSSSHHLPHLPGLLKLATPSTLTIPGLVSAFRSCPGTSAFPPASLPPALPLPNYICLCVHFPLLPSF